VSQEAMATDRHERTQTSKWKLLYNTQTLRIKIHTPCLYRLCFEEWY